MLSWVRSRLNRISLKYRLVEGPGHLWLHTTHEGPWPHHMILEVSRDGVWTLPFGFAQFSWSWLLARLWSGLTQVCKASTRIIMSRHDVVFWASIIATNWLILCAFRMCVNMPWKPNGSQWSHVFYCPISVSHLVGFLLWLKSPKIHGTYSQERLY